MIKTESTRKKQILVVDDAKDNQLLLTLICESNGYEINTTSNGSEALSLIDKMPRLPDLIVLDTEMPVMDGFEFRTRQLEDVRLRNIPVIILTASEEQSVNQKMKNPRAVIRKPFQINHLLDSIWNASSVNH